MKIITKQGRLSIDKKEIDALISAKKFIGLNKSPRVEKVIVSLTSYKPRINDVKYAVYSLLNQTFPPDKLILWLDEDSFPRREKDLPRDLLKLRSFGLTIAWGENLRSYKKFIYALEKYPEDIIVTADDDLFYRPDWLKILYDEHLEYPDNLIGHSVSRIQLDTNGTPYPFITWHPCVNRNKPMLSNSVGTGGGVLFKRAFFHADVLRRELFRELAPLADELWFWAMAVLNDTKTKTPPITHNKLIYVDIDMQVNGITLRAENVDKGKNDVQLRKIIEHYPALLEKLIREAAEFKPYLSVVLPVKNPVNVPARLENVFSQMFPDFELILVNCGSRVNLSPLPTNFHVINYPGGSIVDALNLGLRRAAGEYVLFMDENSILPREAFDIVAKRTGYSKADVIHFAGHIQLDGNNGRFVLDDAPELKRDTPTFFDSARQLRAVLWLQNKLSRRLSTKIFRRDFLLKHELTFGNNLSEFPFQALIQAEKYLIVPQAFCFCK